MADDLRLRHAPGRCCPDYNCLYGRWDKKTCHDCGSDCKECVHYEYELKAREKNEEGM